MSIKTFFNKKSSKIITLALAATLVVTAFAVYISGTFAAKNPINKTFANPNPTGYTLVEAGKTLAPRAISGSVNFETSQPSVATVTGSLVGTINNAVVSGVKAGTAAISVSSKTGGILVLNYQVYDNSKIASYSLANGGEIVIPTVAGADDVESILTATSGAGDDVSDGIIWSSLNTDIATVSSDGVITPVAKGGAILIGTVTDKWGVERQIPVLVLIGSASNSAIDDGEGNFYIPTDNPYVFIESDQDGKIKLPPSYVYDKDKNPANGVDGPAYEKGGEFYIEDPADSNIYKQIDKNTGNKIDSPALWGGTTPGLGNDANEQPVVKYGTSYYIENGDNTFWGPAYGTNKGTLVGGGTQYNPATSPVTPIYTDGNGKHYVGPVGADQVYYGDPANGNGKLDSDTTGAKVDDVVYYKLADGTMTTVKPVAGATQGSDGKWYRPIGNGVWQETTDATGTIASQPEKYVGGNQTTPNPNAPLYKITAEDNTKLPPANNYDDTYPGYLTTTPSGTSEKDIWEKAKGDAKTVATIAVVGTPKTEYTVGEKIDTGSLSLEITYADGHKVTIPYNTAGVSSNPSSGAALTSADKEIVITYEGATVRLPITVRQGIIKGQGNVVDGRILSTAKTGDTAEWVEIARNGDYSLIVRSKAIVSSKFNNSGGGNVYSSSIARDTINNWFNSTLAINANLRNYTMYNTAINNLGTYGNANGANQFSYPHEANLQLRQGLDIAFALSLGEAANYCSVKWSNNGSSFTASNTVAAGNWRKLADRSDKWGFRTGGSTSSYASYIDSSGNAGHCGSYTISVPNRPALWVDSSIFN